MWGAATETSNLRLGEAPYKPLLSSLVSKSKSQNASLLCLCACVQTYLGSAWNCSFICSWMLRQKCCSRMF